jgi:hypothetical protein
LALVAVVDVAGVLVDFVDSFVGDLDKGHSCV